MNCKKLFVCLVSVVSIHSEGARASKSGCFTSDASLDSNPNAVGIKNNPAAVVLAAVMQAVAISRTNEYNKERVLPHNPSVSYGTDITVQEQSNPGNAKVVSLETGTDCPGWSSSQFPCLVVTALAKAGWEVNSPIKVEDAIYALTGHKSKVAYSSTANTGDVTFGGPNSVLSNLKNQLTVIYTRKDHKVQNIKQNYAYAAYDYSIFGDYILLADPDVDSWTNEDQGDEHPARTRFWRPAELHDAVETIYTADWPSGDY